jgi:hypothetical protein
MLDDLSVRKNRDMGPVERAIRSKVPGGTQLRTPVREASFKVGRFDAEGLILHLGRGEWATRIRWDWLEGVVPYVRERGTVEIGSRYDVEGKPGTLDGYLKPFLKRATAAWVASLLEAAGALEVELSRPATVRVRADWKG